jgi:hypothetical protein
VTGVVEAVDGAFVKVRTEDGAFVTIRVSDGTYIRDMQPTPRIPTAELERIAFPGAHVMATVDGAGEAVMLRRNFY